MMADAAAAAIAARSTTTSTPSTRSPSLQALPATRCDHSNHGALSARRSQCCGTAAPARSQRSGPPPPLTAMPAGSTAARPLAPASQRWHRRCQEATAALPAALRSGGSGSSAARTAQLRALWRCPAGSAVCIVAPPAAPGQHWRCIRAAPEPAGRRLGAAPARPRQPPRRGCPRGHAPYLSTWYAGQMLWKLAIGDPQTQVPQRLNQLRTCERFLSGARCPCRSPHSNT